MNSANDYTPLHNTHIDHSMSRQRNCGLNSTFRSGRRFVTSITTCIRALRYSEDDSRWRFAGPYSAPRSGGKRLKCKLLHEAHTNNRDSWRTTLQQKRRRQYLYWQNTPLATDCNIIQNTSLATIPGPFLLPSLTHLPDTHYNVTLPHPLSSNMSSSSVFSRLIAVWNLVWPRDHFIVDCKIIHKFLECTI
jgi:hypothetical protein